MDGQSFGKYLLKILKDSKPADSGYLVEGNEEAARLHRHTGSVSEATL